MQILRLRDVETRTGFCGERLRQLERTGQFPRRFKLTADSGQQGAVGWLADEVDDWIRERAATREEAEVRTE